MIKLGNLSASLRQWLMSTLQLGPGIGDVHYLAVSGGNYHLWLLDNRIDTAHIHATLAAGEDALVANRNDVLCIFPGDHTITAGITWDKSQTHMIGLGGPNMRVQPSTLTTGGLRIKTVTTGVPYLLDIQGNYCQFHGIGTFNNGAATTNLGDIGIIGKNNYFKRCDLRGGNNSTQNTATTPYAGVPVVFEAGTNYGNGTTFEECQIGSPGNAVRTHGAGAVLFLGGGAFGVKFKRCDLETWIETLGADVALVKLNALSTSVDRNLLFEDTNFYNFWTNLADKMNYAVVDGCNTTHSILFRRCTLSGIDFASNVAAYSFTDMAQPNAGGGVVAAVTVA